MNTGGYPAGASATRPRRRGLFYGYVIVGVAAVILAVIMGGYNTFGVFFAPMLAEFGWTRAVTSGAYSLSLVVYALFSPFVGRLGAGRPRLVLSVSSFIILASYLSMSRVNTVWQLYLAYGVLLGIGQTGVIPMMSTVARWFVKKRGIMTGFVMAGTGAGTITMPLLVAWFINSYGWRDAFIIFGIISLVIVISAAQLLRRDPQSYGQLPDGEAEAKPADLSLKASGYSLSEAMRTRQLWLTAAAFFCFGFVAYPIVVHIVIHATGIGVPATTAVSIVSVIGFTNILARIVMGNTADRIGGRPAMIIGFSVVLVAIVWLLFARELWSLYVFGVIFGFGWGSMSVQMSPIAAELFGLRAHGGVYGIFQAALTLGGTVSPTLVGYIYDVTKSYQQGFLILALVAAAGLAVVWVLKLTTKRSPS
ncbi:MAG: MFS transporter [Chloroflexi bacterium]|nr:MFS transporter [Chloroflexota bacterium]